MTQATDPLSATVRSLRQEFDASFARAPRTATEPQLSLLAIRLSGNPYALRVNQIAGLHADRCITPLPSNVASLLGVTGLRGQIAPVYDLASLCGYARTAASRWMVLLRPQEPVALAFECFEMHFTVARDRIVSTPAGMRASSGNAHVNLVDAVQHEDLVRPIVDLNALLQHIQQHAGSPN